MSLISEQCFCYFDDIFDENIIDEIIKIIKTLYGNFPGLKMSESQRTFVSSFFKKIDNNKVWGTIKKTEGIYN